jgi:hypothetical protein
MKKHQVHKSVMLFALAFASLLSAHAAGNPPATTTLVQKTVTVRVLGDNKRMPDVYQDDLVVKQGKDQLKVTGWTPARGDRAGLDLFILIDDASDFSLASQFNDLRAFINAQPATTAIGLGYMQNGGVRITQNFTTEHDQVAKALRIPIGSAGAYGSPYLSVIDLMKRWPENSNRREVIMITDGIDRARRTMHYRGYNTNPDVTSASIVAQRTGTIVHTIFTRGVGRLGRNFWEITNGQNSMARLSDITGGESYYLGTTNPVSFKPYLDDLQNALDNQYLLQFHAIPGKKSGLQPVKLNTEVAGVELNTADNVWVEAK